METFDGLLTHLRSLEKTDAETWAARNLRVIAELAQGDRILVLGALEERGVNGTIMQEIKAACKPQRQRSARPMLETAPARDRCTDLGNARRLVRQHGQDIRFCYAWNTWLAWDGKRWKRDDMGLVEQRAKATVATIYAEAAQLDGEARKELATWAMKSESRDRIRAMVDLARSEPGIPIQPDEFDMHPMLLNVLNGTIDLRTGELRSPRREDLITALAPVPYDPAATCPIFDRFIARIMANNDALQNFIQRVIGYCLTADVSEQMLAFAYGMGANGKSTLIKVLLAMLGKDYATQAAPELLLTGDRHPAELADLRGLRFVAAIEVEDGKRMAEGLVKQMTGGDVLKARFMRENFFSFEPTFKLLLAANHKPTIRGTDHAIWRRIRMIPFTVTIPDDEKDPHLSDKLRDELPGILAWAVRGCLAWQQNGLTPPAEVTAATQEYRDEMDVLARWLEERTLQQVGVETQAKYLHADYMVWCRDNNEFALNTTRFGRALAERPGIDKYKHPSSKVIFYTGIGLLTHDESGK